ncbi:hypothetical protein ACHQM5_011929 [Ranunculus cassubicifolius]
MGCSSSKRIESAVVSSDVVYRPAPSSFALFDISTVEEPWLKGNNNKEVDEEEEENDKQMVQYVPAPILEKLNTFELANEGPQPHSWSEVSKALEELKPNLHDPKPEQPKPKPKVQVEKKPAPPTKSNSFHTLEELDKKKSSSPKAEDARKVVLRKVESKKHDTVSSSPAVITEGFKPVTENIFIMKDRLERGKDGKIINFRKDPLSDYPEKCPPGGEQSAVLYTTTLRGVRRTFEDCSRIRTVIELHGVVFDERDVSLHGEFLSELRELLGEGVSVPRLFIKGRYIGGVNEVVELNELGKLSKLLNLVGKNREPCSVCDGCGGCRFIPCLECGGSCKVVIEGNKERCGKCNENGLVQCPVCH